MFGNEEMQVRLERCLQVVLSTFSRNSNELELLKGNCKEIISMMLSRRMKSRYGE